MTQKYVGKNTAMFENNSVYFGRVAVMLNSTEDFTTQMSGGDMLIITINSIELCSVHKVAQRKTCSM